MQKGGLHGDLWELCVSGTRIALKIKQHLIETIPVLPHRENNPQTLPQHVAVVPFLGEYTLSVCRSQPTFRLTLKTVLSPVAVSAGK